MIRIKRFYLMLIVLIILLPIGINCYAGFFSTNCLYKKKLFDKIMILEKGKIDLSSSERTFIENDFNLIYNQIPNIYKIRMDNIRYVKINSERRRNLNILQWDLEIEENTYHIYVNRYDKTVTIGGEAEDGEEKEKVEHIIELRAPDNFEIINKIEVQDNDLG